MDSALALCCTNVDNYLQVMRLPHSALRLVTCCSQTCLSTLVAALAQTNCLQRVAFLSTEWTPLLTHGPELQLWSLFSHLKSLELRLQFSPELLVHVRDPRQLPSARESPSFPSVHHLSWRLPACFVDVNGRTPLTTILRPPSGLPIFPSVTNLNYHNVNYDIPIVREIMSNISSTFPAVDAASFGNKGVVLDIGAMLVPQLLTLSRLEFCVGGNEGNQSWALVLTKFAPALVHLGVGGVSNVYGMDDHLRTLTLPRFPRLETFTIKRSRRYCVPKPYPRPGRGTMDLKFNYDSELDYARQFPVLRRLEVAMETEERTPSFQLSDENLYESCLEFLMNNFLPQDGPPCESLKLLIIPLPTRSGDNWWHEQCGECGFPSFKRGGIHYPVELEAEFYARVRRTWPRLRNLGTYSHPEGWEEGLKSEERRRRMKEWLRIGVEHGLLKGTEGFERAFCDNGN